MTNVTPAIMYRFLYKAECKLESGLLAVLSRIASTEQWRRMGRFPFCASTYPIRGMAAVSDTSMTRTLAQAAHTVGGLDALAKSGLRLFDLCERLLSLGAHPQNPDLRRALCTLAG